MIIVIDIGNTNISFGRFSVESDEVLDYANFQTDKTMTTDDLALKYHTLLELWKSHKKKDENSDFKHRSVIISSVVPSLNYPFQHMFEKYYGIKIEFAETKRFPVKINYDYPREIGADRIVNAYAGTITFPDSNLIIVDFGTATNFDIVTGGNTYEGGVIVPGIFSSLRSLEKNASKLPHIDLSLIDPEHCPPVVSKNTIGAIRSGVLHGTGAMLDEMVKRIATEMKWSQYKTIATGGLSDLIQLTAHNIDVIDKHLTLKGLKYFWKYLNE